MSMSMSGAQECVTEYWIQFIQRLWVLLIYILLKYIFLSGETLHVWRLIYITEPCSQKTTQM